MQGFNFSLWLPVIALVLAGLYHSLSDDGAASLFDHFGTKFRFPPNLLPVVIFVFAIASGIIDARAGGADWQHAMITGFSSVLTGLFGATLRHDYVNRKPSEAAKDAAKLLFIVFMALQLTACAWFKANEPEIKNVAKDGLELADIACVVASDFSMAPEVAKDCGLAEQFIPDVEKLLAQPRVKAAKARKLVAHCAQASADGGAL